MSRPVSQPTTERRRRPRSRRSWPWIALAGLVALAVTGVAGWLATRASGDKDPPAASTPQRLADPRPAARQVVRARAPRPLVATARGTLGAPLQDAAAAPAGSSGAILLGGLTAADTSSDAVERVTATSSRLVGHLPRRLHDAAAVSLGSAVYLFGGGDGISQHAEILRFARSGAGGTLAGRLPAASSDVAAAAIGGDAYVVGGFTGTRWLDTIVAWRPGRPARVVAHLPFAVRYAAVTAVGRQLVIAGGSRENGTASDAVLAYSPDTGRVVRVGRLPAPTTHAAAASLRGAAYILGGRGASVSSASSRIVSVDVAARRVRAAGRLPAARSDASAVAVGRRILVAGGRDAAGTHDSLVALEPRTHRKLAATKKSRAITNIYAADGAGMLSPTVRNVPPRVYVPNGLSNTVTVIDQRTFKVIRHFAVGSLPQHVTPAWNLRTLYVLNDVGNSLTPINPHTSRPGAPIPVEDPYNMYFTPDGRYAIVVAERLRRLDFRDAHTFRLHRSLAVPCAGVDHADFSADGSYMLASCEFSGQLVKVDVKRERVVRWLTLPDGAAGMPQDVKLSPDGKVFYVADLRANGLWKVDGDRMKVIGFLHTGAGVHGLYVSRDAKYLYATNRNEGSISVVSFRTQKVVKKWWLPAPASPDMGGVSVDGKVLWLSGRYNSVVYAISTRTGRLLARIPVDSGPHGLCVWPQPGRYSLGHTGILR